MKKFITVFLLLFVVASVAYLFLSEKSKGAGEKTAEKAKTTAEKAKTTAEKVNENPSKDITAKPGETTSPAKQEDGMIVYYFYGKVRCKSCETIEKLTRLTLEENFKDELEKGKIRWKPVNTEEPGNKHFVEDYKLITKSVVLSSIKDGKEVSWRNLDKVWELLGNEEIFEKYITDEIKKFQGEEK